MSKNKIRRVSNGSSFFITQVIQMEVFSMFIGNKEAALEVLKELEREVINCYVVGNDDIAKAARELREALEEA